METRPSRGYCADDRTRGGSGRADRGEGSGARGPGPKAWLTWVVLSFLLHLSQARGERRRALVVLIGAFFEFLGLTGQPAHRIASTNRLQFCAWTPCPGRFPGPP